MKARLPQRSREEMGYRNAIAQAPEALNVDVGGAWTLRFNGVPQGLGANDLRLSADWGGARFLVDLPAGTVERFMRHVLPDADTASLPDELRLAALELLRAELEGALGRSRPLRLESVAPASGEIPSAHRFGFTLSSAASGETIAGAIATDTTGLSFAAPLLRSAKPAGAPEPSAWIESVPIPVRFEAGHTVMDRSELAIAEAGDLILLDESSVAANGELTVAVAPGLGFRARIESQTLTVTQPLGALMAENTNTAAKGAEGDAGTAERIPVRLTFDLGERAMTVAELRNLKPGFTFDLGHDLRRAVSIRAHGQLIGEGELVEIDGTLGVAITSIGTVPK